MGGLWIAVDILCKSAALQAVHSAACLVQS